jgi:hypothetical protein
VHLGSLFFCLPSSLIGPRSATMGVVWVRQTGLEVTDDRAELTGREKPWPEGTGGILTDGR